MPILDVLTKKCSTCKLELSIEDFAKQIDSKDGRRSTCHTCHKLYNKKYYARNRDRSKEKARQYYADNRDIAIERVRNRFLGNRDKVRIGSRKSGRKYRLKKAEDIQYNLKAKLRTRFYIAFRHGTKNGSAINDLGCSVEFLKHHLESQFTEGMTWENWGNRKGKWCIDHIMPLDAFDLTDRQHVLIACHYGNLQPLWMEDNVSKKNKTPTWENYRTIHKEVGSRISESPIS